MKTAKPAKHEETHEEWLDRTCDEAEAEANAKGWLTTEQAEANFLKRRAAHLAKHNKIAA